MDLAKKCDRCGIYYEQQNISFKRQSINLRKEKKND